MSRVKKYLEQKEVVKAKEEVKKLLLAEHKAEWTKTKQDEYDATFKTVELILELEDGTTESSYDYENDCPTFQEWLNETVVVTEAVEEVSHIEVIDGVETKVVDVEAVAEVRELVRPYVSLEITEEMVMTRLEEFGYNYSYLRANAYPPIEEQLDMLYKDRLDGGSRFKDAIKEVKDKYPKDNK